MVRLFASRLLNRVAGASVRHCVGVVAIGLVVAALVATPTVAQQPAYASTNPDRAAALAKQALECLRRGEDATGTETRLLAYQEGLRFAEQALAADDLNADAHFASFANRGRILLLQGTTLNPFNLLSIRHQLDRALELNPDHTDALAAKGGMYRQLPRLLGGSLHKSEECLTRAIALDANAVGARIELAQTYRAMGQLERGIPLLETAAVIAERDKKFRQRDDARALLSEFKQQQ